MLRYLALFALAFALAPHSAQAAKRIALLIGNQDYQIDSLDLRNPHNDVTTVGRALQKVGFEVRIVRDAGLGRLHREISRYTKSLANAGEGAVGFFYYSGHGALNEGDRFNYIIPTDADTLDSEALWDGSMRLRRIVDDLKDKSGNAVHFVVFDACRNELKLERRGKKSLFQSKGFRPIPQSARGMLIAYATAEGETASDVGANTGPYAEALAKALVKPGLEAVNVFREVQISVYNRIGQEPWYTHGALQRVYFAGARKAPPPDAGFLRARDAFESVKDTTDPTALRAFATRFPNSVFADMARALANTLEKPAPPPTQHFAAPKPRRHTVAETYAQLALFSDVLETAKLHHIDEPDEKKMFKTGVEAALKQFPSKEGSKRYKASALHSGGAKNLKPAIYRDTFASVIDAILQGHPGKLEEAVAAAISGLMQSLDQQSDYLPPDAFKKTEKETIGKFGGLGIEVNMRDGLVYVVTPIDGSPAQKAGVSPGDRITHLDGRSVIGMTLNEAVQKMRGEVGTEILLTVKREGESQPLGFKLRRAIITVFPVKTRMEGDIALLRITNINAQTRLDLQKKLVELRRKHGQKLKGFVLDLRNNPGGLLDESMNAADLFLSKGDIVIMKYRKPKKAARVVTQFDDESGGFPLVALINKGTAGGAEIIAGALQDRGRAKLVGQKSAGLGMALSFFRLRNGGAVRVATSRYLTPKWRKIEGLGVTPDFEVEDKGPGDAQMKKALEIIDREAAKRSK